MADIFDEIAPDVESAQPDVFDIAEQSFKPTPVADPVVSRAPAFVPTPAPPPPVSEPVKEATWETLSPTDKLLATDLGRTAKAVISGFGNALEGAGVASSALPPVANDMGGPYNPADSELLSRWQKRRETMTPAEMRQDVVNNPAYQAGGKIKAVAEKTFPDIQPASVKRPLGALGEGVGSTVSFLPGAAFGPLGVAALGALQNGAIVYEDAIKAGAPEDKAQDAFFINAAGGVTEALPIASIFKRLNKATGGSVWKAIKQMAVSGLEEGAQEVFQSVLQNASAKHLYEKERKYLEGLLTSGGVGFGVGFLLAGLGIGTRRTAARVSEAVETKRENDVFDKAIEQNANRVATMGTMPELAQRGVSRLPRPETPEGAVSPEGGTRVQRAIRQRQESLGRKEVEAQSVAEEIGATFRPVASVSMKGVPTKMAAQLEIGRRKNGWEFTPQPGSPIEGQTFYVPEGASREVILKRYQEKLKENEVVNEEAKSSPKVVAPGSLPVVAGQPTIVQPEGQVEAGIAQPQGADQAIGQPQPVLKGGVPSEVQEKVQGEAGVLTPEAPAAVSPEAAATVQKKATPRSDSQEFDKLVAEHGIERDWVTDPDGFYADIRKYGDTASIEGNKKKSKAYQAARRRAAIDIGLKPDDVDTIQGRAKALPKLKEYLAKLNEPDVQEDKETGSTDFLPPGEAVGPVEKQGPSKPVEPVAPPDESKPAEAEKPAASAKPVVQMRPLTKAEAKEFAELSRIARAAREKNGPGLSTEQTQRYQYLESLAGAQDLPIEPAKKEEPKAGQSGKLVVPKGNLTLTGEVQEKPQDQDDLFTGIKGGKTDETKQGTEKAGEGNRPGEEGVPAGTQALGSSRVEKDLQTSGEILRLEADEITRLFADFRRTHSEASIPGAATPDRSEIRNRPVPTGPEKGSFGAFEKARVIIEREPAGHTVLPSGNSLILARRILRGIGRATEAELLDNAKSEFVTKLASKITGLKFVFGDLPETGKYKDTHAFYSQDLDAVVINRRLLEAYDLSKPEASALWNTAISEELIHAATRRVSTKAERAAVWESLSPDERKNVTQIYTDNTGKKVTELTPEVGAYEYMRMILQGRLTGEVSEQINWRNIPKAAKQIFQKLLNFLTETFGAKPENDIARQVIGRIENAINGDKPIEGNVFGGGEAILSRVNPLGQAVEMFERKAAVDPAAARRAVEIGQAANVLARQGVVRGALTNLEGIARGEATTPQQKWLRDLASKVLANPFIRNALRRPVERLNASARYTGDTIETYQTLKVKPDATPEQVSNAAGEAVNDIVSWEQRVADFNSAYLAKRQSLTNGIAKTAEAEMEAYDKLDAADVLLSDFRSMALPILRQSNDTTALQAYTYALGRSQAVRNVLAWVGREVDLTGASTPADVLNLIREAGGRSRIQESIEQQIGAERGVIQAVARIIALVEPIRERLLEARFLYRQQAQTRSTELKQRLERLVAQGSYARALEVFERGAEKLGAEQDRARRELDFYARRTRQQLLTLRALDEVKAISERITSDPEFQAEKREVFGESAQNVRNVMVDIRGSTFVLKPFGGMTDELHLTFGNPTAQSRASLEKIKAYRDRAMAYIASENADPSVAQGLKATFPLLEQFLNPAVSPEAERLLPNFMLKGFHALLRRIGAPERIPYYLLQGAGGTWKAVADATLRARRDMGEQLQRINKAHFPKMSLALHAALKSHGEITPDTYFEKVWNHLAGSRQNFRDIRYLNEGDPIGNGEKVTKEDLAYLEAYRKFHTDLSATSQNIGKRQFSSFRSVLTGIFFDKDGRVRLPFAQGVDMVNRRQPPQYEIEDWLNKWRAAKTPDAKSEFLTDYLDRLVIGYMHGVNQADWVRKFPYSYEAQIREILAESAEQPIDSFGTLVDRVFEKVTVEENEVPPTWEDVRNNLLFDFDSIFKKLERLDTTQKQTDPKNIVETVRSEREFNTERGDVIMPPNWYDYGGVTEGQWSSVSRASMFPYERAHLVAINGIKDALSAVVKDFEQQSKSRNEGFRGYFRTKRESRKARERGELIYSWADAKELLDKVTHYAAGLKMMAEQPQLLTQTDRPYAVLQSGVTQLPVAMVLFRLGAASRNLFGGYTNALLADMAFRNRSWAISVPLRSAELVADTYKNLLTALVHEGNPVGRKIHSLLSSASSRAVIGPIAENFLKSIDEQRQLYRDAAELGLNLNVALWDSLSTLRKFAKTAGNVREPGSPLERIYSVPAAALRMGGMVFGQAGVGKVDSWINTKAYIQARQYEQIYKKMARKYGEQVIAMGLDQFPTNAFGGSYKAVKVREFFTRMAGLDIDAAMRDYYKRWSEADTDADRDSVPLFTEEQRNTLAVATADDFNLATFSNRPYSTKMHSMLNTLGLFYGYPDWWIHKLLSTANLNSRKGLTEGRLENMPFLLNYALLFALASIMGMEGVEWLKEWLLNQKSAYPTLTDAKTAPAAARAAAGAVAFNTPFIGGAVSSAFDLGYHGSNNPYDLFFIPGMLKAAANVGVETWQTGEPVLPMMKFADRYLLPVPSHKLTDATAGSRALVNTGNILEMSARANDDEEKLKPRDTAGFQRDYTPATPIITRAMNAIGNGDMAEFQKEYNALVQEYRRQGKSDPERNARQSLMTRNPISQRFAKRPTEAEFSKYLSGLTETERNIVTETLNNYRQAMGIIGAAPSFTAGETRGGGGGATSFRPTGSAAAFATAATGTPARLGGGRVRSALSTSRSRYPRRARGVRTRLTAARRRPRRVSRIRTSRVRRAKLPRFNARIRRPRRIRISPRRQFV